jgi:hypothetical protein
MKNPAAEPPRISEFLGIRPLSNNRKSGLSTTQEPAARGRPADIGAAHGRQALFLFYEIRVFRLVYAETPTIARRVKI